MTYDRCDAPHALTPDDIDGLHAAVMETFGRHFRGFDLGAEALRAYRRVKAEIEADTTLPLSAWWRRFRRHWRPIPTRGNGRPSSKRRPRRSRPSASRFSSRDKEFQNQGRKRNMAGSLNKVTLIGNLGRDPDIRTMQSGGKVASFSLATSESWKDKTSGERKERTEWHNIVVYNDGLVSVVERFLKKGSKIYLEGQLATRKWQDKDGHDRYTTEILLRPFAGEITMLDVRKEGAAEPAPASAADMPPPAELEDEIPY